MLKTSVSGFEDQHWRGEGGGGRGCDTVNKHWRWRSPIWRRAASVIAAIRRCSANQSKD